MSVAEYRRLLDAAPNARWRVFYALAYTSAGRFGELFNLTWADIDFDRGRMIIENRAGMAFAAQLIGAGQAGRSSTDNGHPLAGFVRSRLKPKVLDQCMVAEKLLY